MQGKPRAATSLIFLIVFLDLLGVGLIVPLSPYIVERFDTSATAVAILTLSYSAAQFLATPILGALSDRFGRRPVLLFSILGTAIGYVVFALANSLPLLFAARALDGATGGNISTAQAYIADVTPPEHRARSYGVIGAAFGLGFTLGPAFSALLTPFGLMTPVWAAAALALVTATLVFFFLPETLPPEKRHAEPFTRTTLNPFRTLISVLALPLLAPLVIAMFFLAFAHAELRTSFGVLLRDKLDYTERDTSWMFAYIGLLAVLVQGGLVRRIVPALGDRRTALLGLPIAAVGYALVPLGDSITFVILGITLMALGGGLASPTITSLLSSRARPEQQGAALGAAQSASALSLVLGPIVAGQLYDRAGQPWPFWTASLFVLAALMVVTARTTSPTIPLPADGHVGLAGEQPR